MVKSLSPYTLSQLEVMVIYGVAAFILIVLGPVAIIWYQSRQAAQSNDAISHALISEMSQAFLFVILFEILVYGVFAFLIIASGSGPTNPALGIFGFFNVDWLNPEVYRSLSDLKLPPGGGSYSEEQMVTARGMYGIMFVATLAFTFVMIAFFAIMINNISSLFLSKHRMAQTSLQKEEEATVAMVFRWLAVAAVAGIFFTAMLHIMEGFVDALLQFARSMGRGSFPGGEGPFHTDMTYQMLSVFRNAYALLDGAIRGVI